MANVTNEQREDAAAAAALAAGNSPPEAYEKLVAPYPVWAAMHACGVSRTTENTEVWLQAYFKMTLKHALI